MTGPRSDSSRARGALLGLAVGDAVGTTVEFMDRGSFPLIEDMTGGGPFGLEPGQWTDDTSMALCLGESLRTCGSFDARDQMERYVKWWGAGYLSSTGSCFDIGWTVRGALARFVESGIVFAGSTDEDAAGNGCIMRLAPVVIRFSGDETEAIRWARESSRTTHGAQECLECCDLLARALVRLLHGATHDDLFEYLAGHAGEYGSERVAAIAGGEYREKPMSAIRGTGYVVACLEAALWCFSRANSFRECVLEAANLGEDADTTAAVAGQLAGAHFGEEGIPAKWLELIHMRSFIGDLADDLARQ